MVNLRELWAPSSFLARCSPAQMPVVTLHKAWPSFSTKKMIQIQNTTKQRQTPCAFFQPKLEKFSSWEKGRLLKEFCVVWPNWVYNLHENNHFWYDLCGLVTFSLVNKSIQYLSSLKWRKGWNIKKHN